MLLELDLAPAAGLTHTVYGVVLNHHGSVQAMGGALTQPPYQALPQAPVLYIKPFNTWAQDGAQVALPADAGAVEIGATLALIIGQPAARLRADQALAAIAGCQLAIDLSLPHSSYYRPAIREKCFDGSCVFGAAQAPAPQLPGLVIQTLINGREADSWAMSDLIRSPQQLLAEITAYMTLQAGDRLLVGVKWQAPQARPGDAVTVQAAGLPSAHCAIAEGRA
jgi:5-oxopent-3-ene-1,2,5-tricarboxylate decarboxylase/2-hydroxyhepta-2,4-diene-1,7-dioate isomerase